MIPFQKSIAFRLLIVTFILLALPLLVDSFVLLYQRYQHAIEDAKDNLIRVAELRKLPLSQLQPLDKSVMEVLVRNFKLESHFPQAPNEEMNEKMHKLAQVGGFHNIFLLKIDPAGRYIVIASGLKELIGKDYTDIYKLNNFYIENSPDVDYTSYITLDPRTLNPCFMLTHEIYSTEEKRIVGILVVTDDMSSRVHNFLKKESHPYTVEFALLLPSTLVFASSDPDLEFHYFLPLKPEYKELFVKEVPAAAAHLDKDFISVNHDIGAPFFEFIWKEERQIGIISPLPGVNYSLLTYVSKTVISQAPLLAFFRTYNVYGLILMMGGALTTWLTMRMAKPIQNLSLLMQHIQEGNLTPRYQKDPLGFEINTLGAIFNETIDTVLEKQQMAEDERVKKEILAKELRMGQQVQRNLLPQMMPLYPGVKLAEIYIPAIEVGGDFYDVFIKQENGDSKLVLAIADASGKGVQACCYSLGVRNMLRSYAREFSDIAEAMIKTNNLFNKDTGETGMFVTVLAGIYDHRTKILNYYSCGHNPGLVRRKNRNVEVLKFDGMAMGILPAESATSFKIQLEPGDTVVFYTDGITDALNDNNEFFGEQRLIACLQEVGDRNASDIVEGIVKCVNTFVGNAPQYDDITLLIMKIT